MVCLFLIEWIVKYPLKLGKLSSFLLKFSTNFPLKSTGLLLVCVTSIKLFCVHLVIMWPLIAYMKLSTLFRVIEDQFNHVLKGYFTETLKRTNWFQHWPRTGPNYTQFNYGPILLTFNKNKFFRPKKKNKNKFQITRVVFSREHETFQLSFAKK
jgi:hypothetical protein